MWLFAVGLLFVVGFGIALTVHLGALRFADTLPGWVQLVIITAGFLVVTVTIALPLVWSTPARRKRVEELGTRALLGRKKTLDHRRLLAEEESLLDAADALSLPFSAEHSEERRAANTMHCEDAHP